MRNACEDGLSRRAEPGVVVGGDHADAVEPACEERLEERAPVRLGLAQGARHSQDAAFAVASDADGDEDRAVDAHRKGDPPWRTFS